jgi:hypothetical protein
LGNKASKPTGSETSGSLQQLSQIFIFLSSPSTTLVRYNVAGLVWQMSQIISEGRLQEDSENRIRFLANSRGVLLNYGTCGKIDHKTIRDRPPKTLSGIQNNRLLDLVPHSSRQAGKIVQMTAKKIVRMIPVDRWINFRASISSPTNSLRSEGGT